MPEPIRVLQVFGRMDRGGAETTAMNVFRNIDRQKVMFDFVVHTEDKGVFDDEIYQLGGRIFRVPMYYGKNHFSYKKSWETLFKKHSEHKIIHGNVRSTAAIYLKIAKRNNMLTIAHCHSTSSGSGFDAIIKNVLQLPIRYIADYLFACSKPTGEWLFGKEACNKENFYILNNAIATEKFIFNESIRKAKRNELQISDKFVIGHVGNFLPAKNHNFLIDAFHKLYSKNRDARLLLVGGGPLEAEIRKKVKRLKLDGAVIFAGVRSDVHELLQAMDVFVFPSFYEGFPIVLIEAQASGLHCVVSDTITREVFFTGLVEARSIKDTTDAWAEKVLEFADGYARIDMYDEIVAKGYDIKDMAKWLADFYFARIDKA